MSRACRRMALPRPGLGPFLCSIALCAALFSCSGDTGHRVLIQPWETPTPAASGVARQTEAASAATASALSLATPAGEMISGAGHAVALAPGVPAELLQRRAAGLLHLAEAGGQEALLSLAHGGEGVPGRYWVPVTDLFNDAVGLSFTDLVRILRGEVWSWTELGASASPITVLLPAEQLDELSALLSSMLPGGLAAIDGARVLPQADLIAQGGLRRGTLALLPLEDVDYHVRALALDGVDLLRGKGNSDAYALVTRIAVSGPAGARADGAVLHAIEQALTAPLPAPERLLATGDIIPARCVYERQARYKDYRHAFLEVAETLRGADLTIGSLDASISDKGVPIGCRETFSLMAPAESIQGLTFAGIGLLTVAANHAKDCGERACGDLAFLDTLARLDAAGIGHAGGGRSLTEARTATVITVKGVRFGFLGYDDIASQYYGAGERSPGTAPLDLTTLAADVGAAGARSDVVVVMVHWGVEYTPDPTERQRKAAKIAVEAGAALVVGNHPHVVQAVEALPGGFAAYALGNFVFDQDWSQETLEGVVMEAVFDATRLRQVSFAPLRIQDMHQPHFLTREAGRGILDRMLNASLKLVESGQ